MTEYEELAKKYNLSSFEELNKEFDIGILEEVTFPLREIRKKMTEMLEILNDMLGSLLQPNPDSIVDMYECNFFDDKEKNEILTLYKEIQTLIRGATICQIEANEKTDAEWIEQVSSAWKDLKKRGLPFIQKMKDIWKEKTPASEKLRYLG